jgi:hypothetical protein
MLFHPDETYSISHPTDQGDDCIALRFGMDTIADALGPASRSAHAWILSSPTQRAIQKAAADVLSSADSLVREERALDVLNLIGSAKPLARKSRDAARVESVRERLAADPGVNQSRAVIAGDVGLSPFHFARCFRAHTGTSLHQYRLSLRCQRVSLQYGVPTRVRRKPTLGHHTSLPSAVNTPSKRQTKAGAAFPRL